MFFVLSFYKFFPVEDPDTLRHTLLTELLPFRAVGLLIIGHEGINGTLAFATEDDRARGQDWLLAQSGWGIEPQDFKASSSIKNPFHGSLKIKIREEIVTASDPAVRPANARRDFHLSPLKWQQTLQEERDKIILLDTRNWYETQMGSFRDAVKPPLDEFSEFKDFVKKADIPKDQKILMFCTGGIRCEKASIQMNELGYANVYQLDGGILSYLEHFPHSEFEGECFVFDGRVAVDQQLQPSELYAFCWSCGQPGNLKRSCVRCEDDYVICELCVQKDEVRTNLCSKNCAHLWNLHPGRKGRSQRLAQTGHAIPVDELCDRVNSPSFTVQTNRGVEQSGSSSGS